MRITKTKQTIKYVSIILLTPNNELYVSKRINPNKPMNGQLQCPGGKIEHSELIIQAAHREMYEETGLIINPNQLKYLTKQQHTDNTKDYYNIKRVVYIYQYRLTEKETPKLTEPENATEWFKITIKELSSQPMIGTLQYFCKVRSKIYKYWFKISKAFDK